MPVSCNDIMREYSCFNGRRSRLRYGLGSIRNPVTAREIALTVKLEELNNMIYYTLDDLNVLEKKLLDAIDRQNLDCPFMDRFKIDAMIREKFKELR